MPEEHFDIEIGGRRFEYPNYYAFRVTIKPLKAPESGEPLYSKTISVNDRVEMRINFLWTTVSIKQYHVRFSKTYDTDSLDYIVYHGFKAENAELQTTFIKPPTEFPVDTHWHYFTEMGFEDTLYFMKFTVCVKPRANTYPGIHQDAHFTDFELRGIDGAVQMHKAIAAHCSSYFNNIFLDDTKSAHNVVTLPEVPVSTLQSLKDYMYLGKVTINGDIRDLLVLSIRFAITDLEDRCCYHLSRGITLDNLSEYTKFAVNHNIHKLLMAIFLRFPWLKLTNIQLGSNIDVNNE